MIVSFKVILLKALFVIDSIYFLDFKLNMKIYFLKIISETVFKRVNTKENVRSKLIKRSFLNVCII